MDLIANLTEASKMFRSKSSFRLMSGRKLVEMLYLHIICLRILSQEDNTKDFARQYAIRARNFDNRYDKWKMTLVTDLYYIIYAITNHDVPRRDKASEEYLSKLDKSIEWKLIHEWITGLAHNVANKELRSDRMFVNIDRQFKITDTTFRSIRRLAMNWSDLTDHEKRLCYTRLIQLMRARCPQSDVMDKLDKLSRKLEIDDVCDPETGKGCSKSTLSQAGIRQRSVFEDDGGAPASDGTSSTTAGDIAPFIKSLGAVQRRPKP